MTITELKNKSIVELEELFAEHPYSSIVSSVLAKKAHDENHSSYRNFLSRASLRSPNRVLLKQFIEQPNIEDIPSTNQIDNKELTTNQRLSHFEAKEVVKTLHPLDVSPIGHATEVDEGEIVLDNPKLY